MPIKPCQKNKKEGYKWGDLGKCFTGKGAKQNGQEADPFFR